MESVWILIQNKDEQVGAARSSRIESQFNFSSMYAILVGASGSSTTEF
jgi:hypothetical protein